MKFLVNSIVLWPRNKNFEFNQVRFDSNKINIITGASKTGKSAIIPIIDYCLGAGKCTIPVDKIRIACEWFGVLFDLDGEQMLLCRKEPGVKDSTGEMYFERSKNIILPESVVSNTTLTAVNNILNELFAMSFIATDATSSFYTSRPSYRDFMAFIFQPQNIIANADVLFYKADTTAHREKLINIFPYALGAVTPQVLAARQEMERLRKEKERLTRDFENIKSVAENWKQEVQSWISQARELGLTTYVYNGQDTFEQQVYQLSLIVQKTNIESIISSDNIKDSSDELNLLRNEEQEISSKLFASKKRYGEMKLLSKSVDQYDRSLQIQLNRLNISTWIQEISSKNNTCPLCGGQHTDSSERVNELCSAIEQIEKTAGDMKVVPAAFERELLSVGEEINLFSEKLYAIRMRIQEENGKQQTHSEKKYTLDNVSRFIGRLESAVQTYEKIGTDSDLQSKIVQAESRIAELRSIINENEIAKKIQTALRYIENEANNLIHGLDPERPDDPIEFAIKDLTLRIKNASGRSDYLWEIGSASNWLSYHIAIILAFQKYFQMRGAVSLPSFLVFDQPSQVYFPQKSIHGNKNADDDTTLLDEDKEAVKKIFTVLSNYITATNSQIQIIVLEHADNDVWGDIEHINLVKRWRGNNEKLVPLAWLD
ncbi:MAG: DUF3732 domain-containing protein [Termitinemataceae bacterium]|nr:MAG: DUF3732 domain-containing protein [Termitinemataceae bacterium]